MRRFCGIVGVLVLLAGCSLARKPVVWRDVAAEERRDMSYEERYEALCPYCRESVKWGATSCAKCGHDFRWVPLTCPVCKGTPTKYLGLRCTVCNGTGQATFLLGPGLQRPGGPTEQSGPCTTCRGTGWAFAPGNCPACRGKGKIGASE